MGSASMALVGIDARVKDKSVDIEATNALNVGAEPKSGNRQAENA